MYVYIYSLSTKKIKCSYLKLTASSTRCALAEAPRYPVT